MSREGSGKTFDGGVMRLLSMPRAWVAEWPGWEYRPSRSQLLAGTAGVCLWMALRAGTGVGWPSGRSAVLVDLGWLVASTLGTAAVFSEAQRASREERTRFSCVFGGLALWYGLWLVALWPGLLNSDTYAVIDQVRHDQFNSWYSFLMPLFYLAAVRLVPSFATVGVLQVLGAAATFAYGITVLARWRCPRWVLGGLIVFLAASPVVIANVVYYTRETPFALMHLWLVFLIVDAAQRGAGAKTLIGVGGLSALTATLRGDGVPLLLLGAAGLGLLTKSRRNAVLVALIAGVFFGGLKALSSFLKVDRFDWTYALTLRINPIGHILNGDYSVPNREHVLEDLARVIDLERVRALATPYEIPAFWNRHYRTSATPDDVQAFTRASNQLILHNLPAFFTNRFLTFAAATGLNDFGSRLTDGVRLGENWTRDWTGIPREGPWLRLYPHAYAWLSGSAAYHWNVLPMLLVCLLALMFWLRLPMSATAATLILCRVPLVFLAAPASQFKYYLSLHWGGAFVLALAICEWAHSGIRMRGTKVSKWKQSVGSKNVPP